MARKQKEWPTALHYWWSDQGELNPRHRVLFTHRATSLIEALMQVPPSGTLRGPSLEETANLRGVLVDAVESLDPEDRWIIERLLIEGLSLRKVGAVLGIPKTSLARRRDAIRRQLMVTLLEHPDIYQWVTREVTPPSSPTPV